MPELSAVNQLQCWTILALNVLISYKYKSLYINFEISSLSSNFSMIFLGRQHYFSTVHNIQELELQKMSRHPVVYLVLIQIIISLIYNFTMRNTPGGPRWTHVDPSGPMWTQVDPGGPRWTQVDPSNP